ncbi:unnamed protein product [Penicillium discolor]
MLAIISLIPMSTQGHSGELANHDAAVMSLTLHIVSAAVWLGGLTLLIVIRPGLPSSTLEDILRRYSTLALIAFVVVAVSGYARALTALGRWDDLVTPYGLILLAKILALVVMGILGAAYRGRLIAKAGEGRNTFWMFVCVELAFMGIASGAAAALARTAAPADTITIPQTTAAEILTDAPVPPEFTTERWFTAWSIDLLWVIVGGFAVFFYLAGVERMRRLGQPWPMRRTIGWVIGMGALVWTTSGPLAVRGALEWLLWVAASRTIRLALNPIITAILFTATMWLITYSDLFRWSLYDQLGSEWMITHLLVIGCLFVSSLFRRNGAVPAPGRSRRWTFTALITLTLTTVFIGIATITRTDLIVAEWFGAMGRSWGSTPLQDQRVGGIIIVGIAALLAALIAASVLRPQRTNSVTLPTHTSRKDASRIMTLIALSIIVAPAPAAMAHDNLLDAVPAPEETVTQLDAVALTFSGELIDFSQASFAQVQGPDGLYYESACSTIDRNVLTTPVRLGKPGVYTVLWNAVSSDGHPISESYTFTYAPTGVDPEFGWDKPACGNEESRAQPGKSTPSPTPTTSGETENSEPSSAPTSPPQDETTAIAIPLIIAVGVVGVGVIATALVARQLRRKKDQRHD